MSSRPPWPGVRACSGRIRRANSAAAEVARRSPAARGRADFSADHPGRRHHHPAGRRRHPAGRRPPRRPASPDDRRRQDACRRRDAYRRDACHRGACQGARRDACRHGNPVPVPVSASHGSPPGRPNQDRAGTRNRTNTNRARASHPNTSSSADPRKRTGRFAPERRCRPRHQAGSAAQLAPSTSCLLPPMRSAQVQAAILSSDTPPWL